MKPFISLRQSAEKLAHQVPCIRALAERTADQILHGERPRKKSGTGTAFWQFRAYQSGDSPSAIDWHQSGKTDKIFIRQREDSRAQRFVFWCPRTQSMDFSSSPTHHMTKGKTGAVLALTLALLHARSGEDIAYAHKMRGGHTAKTLQMFEQLLCENAQESLPTPELCTALPPHAGLYIFGDFWEPLDDIRGALTPLMARTKNGTVIQILDPAELDLPYQGHVLFQSTDGAHHQGISNVEDIRAEYIRKITAHNAALADFCTQNGWAYILCRTDESLLKVLENILSRPLAPSPRPSPPMGRGGNLKEDIVPSPLRGRGLG